MPKQKNYLGENIATARRAKGITQLALAHTLGWKGPDAGAQISRIEAGKVSPLLETVCSIARALGVSVDELLGAPVKP